jgi:hypothetical protein
MIHRLRCALLLATIASSLSNSFPRPVEGLQLQAVAIKDSSSKERFVLSDKRVVVGRIISEDDDFVSVKTDSNTMQIPTWYIKSRGHYVEPAANVETPAPSPVEQPRPEAVMSVGKTQDVISLKGGSVIKGRIVKYEPLIVQTADSSLITLNMSDIVSITKGSPVVPVVQSRPPSARRPSIASDHVFERPSSVGGSSFAFFGGFASPVGDFGESSPTVPKAGFAKSGFAAGIEGSIGGELLRGSYGVTLSFNGSDFGSVLAGIGSVPSNLSVNVESGSWTNIWLMLGGGLGGKLSPSFEVRGEGLLGALVGLSPEITMTARSTTGQTASASIDKATAAALAYGVGFGITVSHFDIAFRYLTGSPEYEFKSSGQTLGKAQQPMSVIILSAGLRF